MNRLWIFWVGVIILSLGIFALLLRQPQIQNSRTKELGVQPLNLKLSAKDTVKFANILEHTRQLGERDDFSKQWTKAVLSSGSYNYRVQIRLRGNVANHWNRENISFRVRLKGSNLFYGMKEFNLILPSDREYFGPQLVAYLAKKMGLLASNDVSVWLRFNDQNLGRYVLEEEMDREFLERNGYPFAPIFKPYDSQFFPGRGYLNDSRQIYSLPFWDIDNRIAGHVPQVSALVFEILKRFKRDRGLSNEDYQFISEHFDLPKFARASALSRLLGEHMEVPHSYTY